MDDLDSLRLALEAEKHNHRKDNEFLTAQAETLAEALGRARDDLDGTIEAWAEAQVAVPEAQADALETLAADLGRVAAGIDKTLAAYRKGQPE